jgi:hypothetical protein
MDPRDPAAQAFLQELFQDEVRTHLYFFPHRHSDMSPRFHRGLLTRLYDLRVARFMAITFRGGAKSTLLEEVTLLLALRGLIKNAIIIGDTETRASERLVAIAHEVETNERLFEVFGDQVGKVWTSTRALLSCGTYLQAYGRGMSLRGAKHLEHRPDFAMLDDIESDESVGTPEAIQKTMRWITATLIPAMARHYYIRMAATPLHPNAACMQLSASDEVNGTPPLFSSVTVPVYHYNAWGELESAWEERNPLAAMLEKREQYERLGMAREFAQEYLCQAEADTTKAFEVTSLPIDETYKHTFQPVLIIVDPARTAKKTSSLTGVVVCSWEKDKIIIWEAEGYTYRPADIIDKVFELSARYNPVSVLVEKDGLEEFLMQPFRTEQVRRNHFLPLEAVSAPRGKLDFIRALQPYVKAGEVILAKPCPTLQTQLINFPSGKIDTLNALAYALRHHPGECVYTGFSPLSHLTLDPLSSTPTYTPVLHAISSASTESSGAALMMIRRKLTIVHDVCVQGPPLSAAIEVLEALRFATPVRPAQVILPKRHFSLSDTLGIRSALYAQGVTPGMGGDPAASRSLVQEMIDNDRLRVNNTATWTLRALTGGCAYDPARKQPRLNNYGLLMEAIESAVFVLEYQAEDSGRNYKYTADGRKYLSAR